MGAWRLVSFDTVLPSGEPSKPLGDAPSGVLFYLADGRMSVQISVGNAARFASDDPFEANDAEAAAAWRGYFGYWGSFRVHEEKGVVVHHVEGSSFPNWIGTEQVRQFRFIGPNRLVLETHTAAGDSAVTWERSAG